MSQNISFGPERTRYSGAPPSKKSAETSKANRLVSSAIAGVLKTSASFAKSGVNFLSQQAISDKGRAADNGLVSKAPSLVRQATDTLKNPSKKGITITSLASQKLFE